MSPEDVAPLVIDVLERLELPYMLVGSFSSNYYGVARSTKDVDLVVQLGPHLPQTIVRELGTAFRLDPQVRFETITGTTRYIVHVTGTPFKVEFFQLSNDPHDIERFRRRRRVEILGRPVRLPTAEDVIVTKLRWAVARRAQDADDVRAVIAVQGKRIDWEYVHRWCDQHGTRALLDEIRRSIPAI